MHARHAGHKAWPPPNADQSKTPHVSHAGQPTQGVLPPPKKDSAADTCSSAPRQTPPAEFHPAVRPHPIIHYGPCSLAVNCDREITSFIPFLYAYI